MRIVFQGCLIHLVFHDAPHFEYLEYLLLHFSSRRFDGNTCIHVSCYY